MTRLEFLGALFAAPLGALLPKAATSLQPPMRGPASCAGFNCALEITFERVAAENGIAPWAIARWWCDRYGGRVGNYGGTFSLYERDAARRSYRVGIYHPDCPHALVEGQQPYVAALLRSDRRHDAPGWLLWHS